MSKLYIGIDPGINGFFTFMQNNQIQYEAVPKIKNKIDYHALATLFDFIHNDFGEIHVVLEDVHSIFGSSAKSTFNFGHVVGFIEGCLNANKIPYTKVAPKKWQREMWEGIPLITKPSSTGKTSVTDTKAMSLMAAKRLFPNEDLRATLRSKKPDDNKIDSLLMAEYCKRKFK